MAKKTKKEIKKTGKKTGVKKVGVKKSVKKVVPKKPKKGAKKMTDQYILKDSIKVEWWTAVAHLAEAVSNGLAFAFCSLDNKQCHPFVHCKDFLQDAVACAVNNNAQSIFGFSFDAAVNPKLDLNQVRMLIGNQKDPDMKDKIANSADFMHQFEKKLGMETLSTYTPCDEVPNQYLKSGIWLVTSDKRWLRSPPMVSLYSLMLRVSFSHKKGDDFTLTMQEIKDSKRPAYQPQDTNRLIYGMSGIERILSVGDEKIFYPEIEKNYPKTVSISSMHGSFGIVGFSQNSTKASMPDWHKEPVNA